MAKSKLNDYNFVTMEGWMRTRLSLRGNELLVYAVIFQYSHGKGGKFMGGLAYLAEWCGCHIDTARSCVHSLEEKGLIVAERGDINGIPYCNYIANEESLNFSGIPPKNAEDTPEIFNDDPRNFQGKTINKTTSINTSSNNIDFDFRTELLRVGVTAEVADAWIDIRRKKKCSFSRIAFKELCTELGKVEGMTNDECIRKAVARNWAGFEASWLQPKTQPRVNAQPRRQESVYEHNARVWAEMFGPKPDEQ